MNLIKKIALGFACASLSYSLSVAQNKKVSDTTDIFTDAKEFIINKTMKERPNGDYILEFKSAEKTYTYTYSSNEYFELRVKDSANEWVEFFDANANGLNALEGDHCTLSIGDGSAGKDYKDLDEATSFYRSKMRNIKSLYNNRNK